MPSADPKYISAAEYLAMEQEAFEKHEYYKGEVIAMAGATETHNRISRNLITEIGSYLKGKSCEVFGSDMRVTTPLFDSYMYPDVMIVCGDPEKKPDCFDTITNPTAIIEIMSPSTYNKDRVFKFLYYLQIPSLKEYILIETSRCSITTFRKQADNSWQTLVTDDIDATHKIESIGFDLKLRDVYYKVEL